MHHGRTSFASTRPRGRPQAWPIAAFAGRRETGRGAVLDFDGRAAAAHGAAVIGGLLAVSQIPLWFLLKRLLLLEPLVLGVAGLMWFQPDGGKIFALVMFKANLCLLTTILLSNTTPFAELLRVLQRLRMPWVFVTTLTLMHRYLFVLRDEAERMRRARASRTFTRGRRFQWLALSSVLGQLFVRASERAERIYNAMCARGWK